MSTIRHRGTIPVLFGFIIVLHMFFSSCADKIKTHIIAFEALNEGLVNSNFTLTKCSQTMYASLEQKTTEPSTSEKAKLWLPKAMLAQKLSTDAYNYIEGLKTDLKKEAGLKISDGVESYKESDKTAVMRLFEKKKRGEELFERLKNFKHEVLTIDIELEKEFTSTMILTTPAFDDAKEKQDFTRTFFKDIPAAAALAMLTKFQNNIKVNENKMATYCNNKIGTTSDWGYTTYSAIAVINRSYVRPGEEIEITSGMGEFNRSAQPIVLIQGKNVELEADGAAHFKFKAPNKSGKHVIPVQISFTDQEGKKQTISKNIEYTVAGQ